MKKTLIIGDSHAQRMAFILNEFMYEKNSNDENFLYNSSKHEYENLIFYKNQTIRIRESLFKFENKKCNFLISSHLGRSAFNFNFKNFGSGSQNIFFENFNNKNNAVFAWFGYIDIKNNLPRKNLKNYVDSAGVVEKYVNSVIENFNNCEIFFIEPVPQFITHILSGWRNPSIAPDIEFEERYEQHKIFVDELQKKCSALNLNFVSLSDILGTDMIFHWMQPKKPINKLLNDHLKPDLYKVILNYIYKEILKLE